MEQKYTWLSTSVFCSKNHWNHLLNEIALFLHKMHLEKPKSILLQFNYLGGENIRWALFIPAEQADSLARQIDHHFNYFFSKANFPVTEFSLPVEGIVLPFPQNSIQYGLYTPVHSGDIGTMQGLGILSPLSWLMIEALASDNIDDEVIVTFAFYLQMALIKLMLTRGFTSITELRNMYNYNGIQTPDVITGDKDNYERIFEIADDIINPGSADEVPVWLQKWMDMCDMEIRKELPYPLNNKNLLRYNRLIYQLHMHLGITAKMESILFFYLCLVFRSDIFEELHTI